jgi:hypothetical protein
MNDMAKKAREAMKSKARKMAGEKDQKVDSSDWSPSEPMNTQAQTGMRPISRRAYKKGGKVEGALAPANLGRKARKSGGKVESEKAEAAEYAKAKINRDVKAANEERPGVKHVGGMKKGGRAAKAGGGTSKDGYSPRERWDESREKWVPLKPKPPFPGSDKEIGPSGPSDSDNPDKFRPGKMKSGGRTKKAEGGDVPQPELGKNVPKDYLKDPRHPGNAPAPVQMPKNPPMPPRRPADLDAKSTMSAEEAEAFMRNRKDGGKAKARKDGGKVATTLAGQKKVQAEQAEASETHRGKASNYKKGGRAGKDIGGALSLLSPLAMGINALKGDKDDKSPMKKGGRAGKMMGGVMGDPRMSIVKKNAMDFGSGAQGTPYKKGGKAEDRVERKAGGRTKAKGKTNINIVIAAGKPATPDMMQGPGGPPMPPPGVPVPLPGGPGGMPMPMGGMGGAPGGMPSMPMPPGPPQMPGGPMARKSGGRITKIAKSYKDMEAGAAGGEGRLQKTDIAKSGKSAPAYRSGGKVFRSYKDMDAGSGSGRGRLEKTEIEAHKN